MVGRVYSRYQTAVHLFAFLGLDLPQVELKLLAFQDVTISPAALAGSGGDASCRRGETVVRVEEPSQKHDLCDFIGTDIYH